MACPLYFIVHSLHTRNAPTYTKLWMACPSYKTLNGLSIVFYYSQFAHMRRADVYKTLNGLSIVFYHSQFAHTRRTDVYKTLNGFSTVFYRSQSVHTRRSDVYKTWMACPSHFIVHSPHTHDALTYTWLPTSVGLAQACPNYNYVEFLHQ